MNPDATAIMLAHRKEKRDALGDPRVADILAELERVDTTGLQPFSRGFLAEVLSGGSRPEPVNLAARRSSVRNFTSAPVDDAILLRAAERARNAPSVCNRQATRAHIFRGQDVRRIRHLQNGNAGFRNLRTLAVITADLRLFLADREKNQPWFDAAAFAMEFVNGLTAEGVGTCFLNWCVPAGKDDELRALVPIPEHERVICWLAIGHPAPGALATPYRRRAVEELMTIHPENRRLKVFYWRQEKAVLNLGEAAVEVIVKGMGYEIAPYAAGDPEVTCVVGTFFNSYWMEGWLRKPRKIIWGCGAEGPVKREWLDGCDLRAVRGPLTRAALGLPDDFPTGDPALLLPRYLPVERKPSGEILYAPHFLARDQLPADILAKLGATRLFGIATTRGDFPDRVREIANAEMLLTSSLHAAIIAQAYGTPWALCVPAEGWNMRDKWADWCAYLGLGEPVICRHARDARQWWESAGKLGRTRDLQPLVDSFPHPNP